MVKIKKLDQMDGTGTTVSQNKYQQSHMMWQRVRLVAPAVHWNSADLLK
jgi:hypothetical protein